MRYSRSSVLEEYARLGIKPVSGGEGEGDAAGTTTAPPEVTTTSAPTVSVQFDSDQQKRVDELVAAARAQGRRAAEDAARVKQDQIEDERKRSELEKAGEYETAKKGLIEKLDSVTGERDALAAKVTRYEELAAAQVEARRKELPEEALLKFPSESSPLEQLAWLEDRAALVAALLPNGKKKGDHGLTATPDPDPSAKEIDDKAALAASQSRYQNF